MGLSRWSFNLSSSVKKTLRKETCAGVPFAETKAGLSATSLVLPYLDSYIMIAFFIGLPPFVTVPTKDHYK